MFLFWRNEQRLCEAIKQTNLLSDILDELALVRGELESIRNSADYIRSNTERP